MLAAYLVIKALAYVGWCYVGLRAFGGPGRARWSTAAIYGTGRLLLGLFFGVVIFMVGAATAAVVENSFVTYLLVYVPVRWIEWSIVATWIDPGHPMWRQFWLGLTPESRGWRLRGIVLSCLADVPVIIAMGGLTLGRFLC
jgi:hypothetical protein